ncbi:MAG: peptidoglycan editing factor PgeF [Clostridia bacterium]|nr:peptidoglycan editing factor PgeF [Clostridia bacterium]
MNKFGKIINYETGAVYFRAENIPAPHGFSTRLGGVSTIPHLASMNMGFTLGDDPENVKENYRRMAADIGFDAGNIVFTKQIHSTDVRVVGKSDTGNTYECDGFVTNERDIVLTVRTADCVPVLLCDPKAHICSAVHAGWRGTASGICINAVDRMRRLGADPGNVRAAIGAAIQKCCYEVGEDMRDSVKNTAGKDICDRFITDTDGRLYADIVGMNIYMLVSAGVAKDNIASLGECTCCRHDLFFSHRASKGKRGVMCAAIANIY